MDAVTTDKVKVFTSGNSQAIRLPKKFRLSAQTAHIQRRGRSLLITPEEDVWARFDRGVAGLSGIMAEFKREQPDKNDRRKSFLP